VTAIAHIIHPVIVDAASDLVIAQPVTFETMRIARDFAGKTGEVDVRLYAVQYHDEARIPLPGCFTRPPDLNRSVGDIISFKEWRKLAVLKDILDALYNADDADYLIYTNVDIALQPYFYRAAAALIHRGYDAFIINRRSIPGFYRHLEEIPLMYAELGEKHPGWDCFVFKRSLYPLFDLGTACIGTGWIGRVMIANTASLAAKFNIFTDLHLTFHIGKEIAWRNPRVQDYLEHNMNECKKILTKFDRDYGPFNRDQIPGRFLRKLEEMEKRK
jgi:hypothetical protein